MTPEEKEAKAIIEGFITMTGSSCEHDSYCPSNECQYDNMVVCKADQDQAFKAALILVDKILSLPAAHKGRMLAATFYDYQFWNGVRKVINDKIN